MEEDENPREELYKRFCESLRKPVEERFFDEDELVVLFDHAGDLGDDYIRLEVLFCAARLYPESVQIAERKAIFYGSMAESGLASRYFDDNRSKHSCLWDLSRLQCDPVSAKKAPEALDYIFSTYSTLNDEEAIQIVKTADSLDCYDWIVRNLDGLRKKTEYLPSLLYEVASVSERRDEAAFAIKLLDELLAGEPFSAVYWALLYRLHLKVSNHAEATNAFEYASALAGDDNETKLFLVETSVNAEIPEGIADQVLELAKNLFKARPDDFRTFEAYITLLMNRYYVNDAHALAVDFFMRHPDNASAYIYLLYFGGDNLLDYLKRFTDTGARVPFDKEGMKSILDNLVQVQLGESLVPFLRFAEYAGMLDRELYYLVAVAYFDMRLYEGCARMMEAIDDFEEVMQFPFAGISSMLAYVLSVLNCRPADYSVDLCRRLYYILSTAVFPQTLVYTSAKQHLEQVCKDIIEWTSTGRNQEVIPFSLRPYAGIVGK